MYDLGPHFKIDLTKSKTPSAYVYRGSKYRISILSASLIRFEYSETGSFNDYPTFFASNRSFGTPKVNVTEDNEMLIIRNDKFFIPLWSDSLIKGDIVVVAGKDKDISKIDNYLNHEK